MTLKNVAVVLTKKGMGQGPPELMEVLLERYLKILSEETDVPRYLLVYSEGVQVAREGSKYVDWLRTLEQKGCQVMLCSICLEHFGMKGQHPVGLNSCLNDITKAMDVVDKVITL
jgi:hypothetical protein